MSDVAISTASEEVRALFRRAEREALADLSAAGAPLLVSEGIERVLPHRGSFRLIDHVDTLDVGAGSISGRYDLSRATDILSGHFPGRPILPGVMQIEAIGQLGSLLVGQGLEGVAPALTHVLGARFIAPVEPVAGEDLVVVARVLDDGLFFIVVGQCIYRGIICSAAAIRGLPGN